MTDVAPCDASGGDPPTVIHIDKLNVQQLIQIKKQLEVEIETLTQHLAELRFAARQFTESKKAIQALVTPEGFATDESHKSDCETRSGASDELGLARPLPKREALVPLTQSVYVPAIIDPSEDLLIDIGTGYHVQRSPAQAASHFEKKAEWLTTTTNKILRAVNEKRKMSETSGVLTVFKDVGRGVEHMKGEEDDFECGASSSSETEVPADVDSSLLVTKVKIADFARENFDPRLSQALLSQEFSLVHPTHVQYAAIPALLKRRDVFMRARTGSGKTLAFVLPMLQQLIEQLDLMADSIRKPGSPQTGSLKPFQACILAPTKELCSQISKIVSSLCTYVRGKITVGMPGDFKLKPTILIGSPRSILQFLATEKSVPISKSKEARTFKNVPRKGVASTAAEVPTAKSANGPMTRLFRSELKYVVLDEVDAITSLGYKEDIEAFFGNVLGPRRAAAARFQVVLCSATLNPEVDKVVELALHRPVYINIDEPKAGSKTNDCSFDSSTLWSRRQGGVPETLSEFYLEVPRDQEKYLVLYSLLKLNLIKKKCLIFTSTATRAYSLALFLEKFGIPAAVVCDAIPVETRMSILRCFDQSLCQILIATDTINKMVHLKSERESKTDKTCISRGLDLNGVKSVINFDLPDDETTYIHRVGRTARAGAAGVVLSLCSKVKEDQLRVLGSLLARKSASNPGQSAMEPLDLSLQDLECFRYRVEDVLRAVTKKAIVAMRARNLAREVKFSKRLREHFEANPDEKTMLRKKLKTLQQGDSWRSQSTKHLRSLPTYLKPTVVNAQLTPIESAAEKAVATAPPQQFRRRKYRPRTMLF